MADYTVRREGTVTYYTKIKDVREEPMKVEFINDNSLDSRKLKVVFTIDGVEIERNSDVEIAYLLKGLTESKKPEDAAAALILIAEKLRN